MSHTLEPANELDTMNLEDLKRLYVGLTEGSMSLKAVKAEAVTVCPSIGIHKPRTTKHVAECVLKNNIEKLETAVEHPSSITCLPDSQPTQGRTFSYLRVSTSEQTTENQKLAITAAGHHIPEHRVVSETVSGSCQTMERPAFRNLVLNRMEAGDTLVVLKLDRLGRDMIDVMETLSLLAGKGIHVISLDLGNIDLSSPAGKLQVQVMAAVAEFERNRIRERTREGIERAKRQGKALGRPSLEVNPETVREARQSMSIAETAKYLGISVASVKRLQAKA